jgi:DNA-binding NarL/FixJ family response regulator
MSITLLLADDAPSVRMAIRHLLQVEPGITLVGKAATFSETVTMCAELKPTVLLMDLHMPGEQFEAKHIKAQLLGCAKHVLALCAWEDQESRTLASLYGAEILLDKSQLALKLVPAIMNAAQQ